MTVSGGYLPSSTDPMKMRHRAVRGLLNRYHTCVCVCVCRRHVRLMTPPITRRKKKKLMAARRDGRRGVGLQGEERGEMGGGTEG